MSVKTIASLSFVLALVFSISLPAQAELIKNFKTDGSIETKSFGIDNEVDYNSATDDYRSETRTRIFLGGSFDLLDDVHSRILLRKNNRLHGQAAENANSVQTAVSIDNAYVKIDKIFKHVDLTIGRQFYGNSNDLNIYYGAQPDDVLSVTALDIFQATADIGSWAKITGIAGKTVETTGTSATAPPAPLNSNGDSDIWGFDVAFDVLPKSNLSAAYYTLNAKNPASSSGSNNNTLHTAALKAIGELPILTGFGYEAQLVQNFGRDESIAGTPAYDGTAYFLGANMNREILRLPLRAHAEYGRGTSDFAAIAPGKRFGKIWGEHTNAVATNGAPSLGNGVGGAGLTNLRVFDLGAGVTLPNTNFGFDLNWYNFMYDDAALAATGQRKVGAELDFIVSYKHSDNVFLEASAARFWVDDAIDNAAPTGTSPISRIGADVKIKF